MEKKILFSKIWFARKTAKTFFAAILLFNFFSSFLHLYYSREKNSDFHLEGDIIVYNLDHAKSNINSQSRTPIYLEGNVLLYENGAISNNINPKKLLISKTDKKGKRYNLSNSKKFNPEKPKICIRSTKDDSDVLFCSSISNGFAINSQNFNENFAIKRNLDFRISLFTFLEKKLNNRLFSEKLGSIFFNKYFGRPPPFLV